MRKNITVVLADASSSGTLSNNALPTALWYCQKECYPLVYMNTKKPKTENTHQRHGLHIQVTKN